MIARNRLLGKQVTGRVRLELASTTESPITISLRAKKGSAEELGRDTRETK
jgi:hypothetical protein